MVAIHLLVLIHGMWGNPKHLSELARIISETHTPEFSDPKLGDAGRSELRVLVAEAIQEDSTYDGIDWGGERVAKEVLDEVEQLRQDGHHVTRFSVTGYSLGGLVARYLIGVLHHKQFFATVTPVNFNTIATPHIGLLRYPSFISSLLSSLGPKLLSRTGEQFYCVDKWSTSGRPLLLVMADPARIFHQALSLFAHIRIYANAVNDITVPYVTSAIESEDPFIDYQESGMQLEFDNAHYPLVKSYYTPSEPCAGTPSMPKTFSAARFQSCKPDGPSPPLLPHLRFPLNTVIYIILPILVPIVLMIAIIRFSLATRSSRARIRLLERDSQSQRLVHLFSKIECEVEDAMADLIDNSNPSSHSTSVVGVQPILSSNQRKIIRWLNQLPMKKELAFFPAVRNSHAMIVCRDVKNFELHKKGEGILRHLANSFVL